MIDVSTWRRRIGGAPGILSRVLGRKAASLKVESSRPHPHEDEDLMRKFLKGLSLRQISYLVLVISLISVILVKNRTTSLLGNHDIIAEDPENSFQFRNVIQTCDTLLEGPMVLACAGLCLSQVGALHFIFMLLIMAGIEPNPGPRPPEQIPDSSAQSSPRTDESYAQPSGRSPRALPGYHMAAEKPLSPERPTSASTTASTDLGTDPPAQPLRRHASLPRLRTRSKPKASSAHAPHDTSGYCSEQSRRSEQHGRNTASGSRGTSHVTPSLGATGLSPRHPEGRDSEEMVYDVRKVLDGYKVDLGFRNIDSEKFQHLLQRLDSHSSSIIEVDLRFSKFCSAHWHEHPEGERSLVDLLEHTKLKHVTRISLDIATFSLDSSLNPPKLGLNVNLRYKSLSRPQFQLLQRLLLHVMPRVDVTSLDLHKSSLEGRSWEIPYGDSVPLDELIREDRLQTIVSLDMSHMSLTEIPKGLELTHHHRLKKLNLSGNKLESIERLMKYERTKGKENELVELNLSMNLLKTLPQSLDLPNLETLNLEENPMFEIPSVVGHLPKLQTLIIGSPQTCAVHRDVLQRVLTHQLTIEVPPTNRDKLLAPKYTQLKTTLPDYIREQTQFTRRVLGESNSSAPFRIV